MILGFAQWPTYRTSQEMKRIECVSLYVRSGFLKAHYYIAKAACFEYNDTQNDEAWKIW